MPCCPKCAKDYPAGKTECPACGTGLVEPSREEPAATDAGGLAELARFSNASEADMAAELLESNGIRSVVRGEVDPIAIGYSPSATTLLVASEELERAAEIFEAFFARQAVVESSESDDD